MGAWTKSFANYEPKYLSRHKRVPNSNTSGKKLPIDINFISICIRSIEKSCLNSNRKDLEVNYSL